MTSFDFPNTILLLLGISALVYLVWNPFLEKNYLDILLTITKFWLLILVLILTNYISSPIFLIMCTLPTVFIIEGIVEFFKNYLKNNKNTLNLLCLNANMCAATLLKNYTTILDTLDEGVALIDKKGLIIYHNTSWKNICNLDTNESHVGKEITEVFPTPIKTNNPTTKGIFETTTKTLEKTKILVSIQKIKDQQLELPILVAKLTPLH